LEKEIIENTPAREQILRTALRQTADVWFGVVWFNPIQFSNQRLKLNISIRKVRYADDGGGNRPPDSSSSF